MLVDVAEPTDDGVLDLDALVAAIALYRDRWFRPLTIDELREAAECVQTMRDTALRLQERWTSLVRTLPSADDVAKSMADPVAHGWLPSGIRSIFQSIGGPSGLRDLVGRINAITANGHDVLRCVRPSIPCARHYERQCSRLDLDSEKSDLAVSAEAARDDLESIERLLDGDAGSQRSQIEILNMHSQTNLASDLRELTRVVAILTVFLVLATLVALFLPLFHH
jgi:hypothetical protein